MSKLSIRTYLLGIITALTLAIAAQGMFALSRMSMISASLHDVATNWMPSVNKAREMAYVVARYRTYLARHILETENAQMIKVEEDLKKRAAGVAEASRQYVALISSTEEKAIYEAFARNWEQHEKLTPKVLELSRSNRNAEARDLFMGEQSAVFNRMAADAEQLVAINTRGAEQSGKDGEASAKQARLMTIALLVAALIIAFAASALVLFRISRPLRALVLPIETIAGGDFTVNVPGAVRKDEIGQIAAAVEAMTNKIGATIAQMKQSANEVSNAAAEISTATSDLSQRTEEQAASLEETSAAMEQMSSTVRRNAENAQLANQDASTTREVADRGGQVVARAIDAMAKIEESSRKISDIIGVIDEIARQTNLLALNAAVEAARAGEAGRGFAVVASEVRSLAQRSSQAAKDIKDLITNSNDQVKDGVELVNRAGESLTEIVDSIKKVTVVVSDIANASSEQATGIDQINKALTQMDEVTQQNSALVEENAATAKTLEHQATAMDEQVAVFRTAVGQSMPGQLSPVHIAPVTRSAVQAPAAKKPVAIAKVVGNGDPAPASPGPARQIQTSLAKAVGDEWREF